MTEPLGFSWMGLVFLLCLLAPNLLWTRYKPRDYDPSGESRLLLAMERTGQIWVTCAALICRSPAFGPRTARSWWLVGAAVLMLLYEFWWFRYFAAGEQWRISRSGFWASLWLGPLCRWRRSF